MSNKTSTIARPRLGSEERRATIVEVAGRLFGERGYDATTLDDVAAAAGVTKPIVYRHFDSKRDLYLALLRRHRDDLPIFADAIPASGSTEAGVRAVLAAWLDYVESHLYAWRMLFRDRGGGAEIEVFRREVQDRARLVLVELLDQLTQDRSRGLDLADEADALTGEHGHRLDIATRIGVRGEGRKAWQRHHLAGEP